ncbi:uncharacterized protein LOC142345001 [Convolutriloba macropyga]|uniref:uncharacterized protein LOC142345001 n=1 Tax=Convolutriloba macropyga TaxID=536237 RepID=UPI003F51CEE3
MNNQNQQHAPQLIPQPSDLAGNDDFIQQISQGSEEPELNNPISEVSNQNECLPNNTLQFWQSLADQESAYYRASDHRATEILEQSTVHNEGRYHVGTLWSSDEVNLPNNFISAMVQFKPLEKRLSKDPVLYMRYAQTFQDDLDKGYVIRVESRDEKHCAGRDWYLPYHLVVNPTKPEKVRRVLNGASKFQGISLNNVLLTGPDLLQRLIRTLVRFRQRQFAVSAYIEGMFLQAGVLPAVLRFLWREDPSMNIEVYQYTRHIFGAKDSPTCANYALLRTARDNNSDFPDAAQAVCQNFYMDEYLDSMESPIIVQKISRNLIELLNRGSFKLTKFISNVPCLLEQLEDK